MFRILDRGPIPIIPSPIPDSSIWYISTGNDSKCKSFTFVKFVVQRKRRTIELEKLLVFFDVSQRLTKILL